MAVLLALALAIAAVAGRLIEATIVGVLLLPSLALVGVSLVASRASRPAGGR